MLLFSICVLYLELDVEDVSVSSVCHRRRRRKRKRQYLRPSYEVVMWSIHIFIVSLAVVDRYDYELFRNPIIFNINEFMKGGWGGGTGTMA